MKQNVFSARVHVQTMVILAMILQPFPMVARAASAAAESKTQIFKGTLYDLDSHRQNPLFFYERKETTEKGDKRVEAVFKDPKGNIAVSEKLTYAAGKPQRYEYEQKQNKQSGVVEFPGAGADGGKVRMTFSDAKGKVKTDEVDYADNLVVGPMLMYYLQQNWDEIEKGKEVGLRIIVLDRTDTFGFNLQSAGDEEIDGKTLYRIRLKPSSFFISAVVAPIYFYFDKATRKLQFMRGRTLLRYERDGKQQDLIAETVFE